ncbi:MAG: hypothetical protein USCAAHI_01792 [Beijerinckiaceae bacterium]|nr:MAG: hypothetical protein USCAAHI_01792 [Beijerinckiaceae bacterium]
MTIKLIHEEKPNFKPTIAIGPRLREQLRKELRIRIDEWNFVNAPRRREITREISLIYELLGVGEDN